MRYLISLILFCALLPFTTMASEDISFADKTYFTIDRFDRIYFEKNGTFQQQLADEFNNLPAGSILFGDWVYDDVKSQLCITYVQFNLGQHCFTIASDEGDDQGNITATGPDGKTHFIWRHVRPGNWLLKPAGLQALQLAFDGQNIKNSIYIDNMIANQITGKVFGRDNLYLYPYSKTRGLAFNGEDNSLYRFSWRLENFHFTATTNNNSDFINTVLTVGTEFLDNKTPRLYIYLTQDEFMLEGEDFTLTPYDDFDRQEIFEESR